MNGANWTLRDFAITDVHVQSLGENVAAIGYKVHEELTVDGKPLTLDAADASTWVKEDGRWLCAMHTESLLGDPFGRDRAKAALKRQRYQLGLGIRLGAVGSGQFEQTIATIRTCEFRGAAKSTR